MELAPSPFYYSNTNVHLVDINVFAKFDEIPSLPVQDIKENPKCRGQRIAKGNNSSRTDPPPPPSSYFSIIKIRLTDINVFAKFDEIPSLPVQVIKEKTECRGLRITKGNNSIINQCVWQIL